MSGADRCSDDDDYDPSDGGDYEPSVVLDTFEPVRITVDTTPAFVAEGEWLEKIYFVHETSSTPVYVEEYTRRNEEKLEGVFPEGLLQGFHDVCGSNMTFGSDCIRDGLEVASAVGDRASRGERLDEFDWHLSSHLVQRPAPWSSLRRVSGPSAAGPPP